MRVRCFGDASTSTSSPRRKWGPASSTRVVVVEGNYILGGIAGQPAWDGVAELLAPRLYLTCDPESAGQRVIARHIRGGAAPAVAMHKYQGNDRKNIAAVLASADRADIHITLSPPKLTMRS